jgi:hypothetical protein
MTRIQVRPTVVEVLTNNVGKVVTIRDIMSRLPKGAHDASVRNAVRYLMTDGGMNITAIAAGNSWRLESLDSSGLSSRANPDAGMSLVFELVGEKEDGTRVVRDPDGKLYDVTPL